VGDPLEPWDPDGAVGPTDDALGFPVDGDAEADAAADAAGGLVEPEAAPEEAVVPADRFASPQPTTSETIATIETTDLATRRDPLRVRRWTGERVSPRLLIRI